MRSLLLLFALCSSLALVACGGDDDESSAPSRQEFAEQANKICADLEAAGKRLQAESLDQIGEFASRAQTEIDAAVKRLDDLQTPEGADGEKAQKFIDEIRSDTDTKIKPALQELAEAAESKDQKKIVKAAESIQKVKTDEADRLARDIGAAECAD